MTRADITTLISTCNSDLVHMGFPAPEITALRERFTGHTRRISPKWLPTIAMWGGTHTLREISEVAGATVVVTKSYARARGLRWRTRKPPILARTPAQLAVLAFASLPQPARDAARDLGALPIEIVLGRLEISDLLEQEGVDFAAVLSWDIEQLEATWARLGLSLALPRPAVRPAPTRGVVPLGRDDPEAEARRDVLRRAGEVHARRPAALAEAR